MSWPQRPQPPSAYDIARYWSERDFAAVIDWGEPSCFACGWYSEAAPTAPEVTCRQAWASSGLERAHLVPHALGGSNEVSNYLMLCPPCHLAAPDWKDPTVMLDWVKRRSSYFDQKFSTYDTAALMALASVPDWKRKLEEALTKYGTVHAGHLAQATVDAAVQHVVSRRVGC